MRISSRASKAIISQDGRTAMVSVAVSFLQRGGRKQILSPAGAAPWSPAPRVDTALVKAVVRAHRWRQMIENGKYASSAELAKAEKVNDSYLSRILRLTLVAPDLIEAIMAGRQSSTLQLDELIKPLPAAWDQQRAKLRSPQ
jgi:predicted nucleic acid-binding Zn ribbon protein